MIAAVRRTPTAVLLANSAIKRSLFSGSCIMLSVAVATECNRQSARPVVSSDKTITSPKHACNRVLILKLPSILKPFFLDQSCGAVRETQAARLCLSVQHADSGYEWVPFERVA